MANRRTPTVRLYVRENGMLLAAVREGPFVRCFRFDVNEQQSTTESLTETREQFPPFSPALNWLWDLSSTVLPFVRVFGSRFDEPPETVEGGDPLELRISGCSSQLRERGQPRSGCLEGVERLHQVLQSPLAPEPVGEGDYDSEPCVLQPSRGIVLVRIVICLVQKEDLAQRVLHRGEPKCAHRSYTSKDFENAQFRA
jgi:hypothetical protein